VDKAGGAAPVVRLQRAHVAVAHVHAPHLPPGLARARDRARGGAAAAGGASPGGRLRPPAPHRRRPHALPPALQLRQHVRLEAEDVGGQGGRPLVPHVPRRRRRGRRCRRVFFTQQRGFGVGFGGAFAFGFLWTREGLGLRGGAGGGGGAAADAAAVEPHHARRPPRRPGRPPATIAGGSSDARRRLRRLPLLVRVVVRRRRHVLLLPGRREDVRVQRVVPGHMVRRGPPPHLADLHPGPVVVPVLPEGLELCRGDVVHAAGAQGEEEAAVRPCAVVPAGAVGRAVESHPTHLPRAKQGGR